MTQRRLVNLLPEDAMRSFYHERRSLLISRVLFVFSIFIVILAIFAGASWQYLSILEAEEERHRKGAESSEEILRVADIELQLGELSNDLKVLNTLTRCQYDPALLSKDIVSLMPAGVTLDSYTITFELSKSSTKGSASKKQTEPTIYISGHASTRASVLAYQHALGDLLYTAVLEAPVENILKPVDTVFSFDMELKPLPEKAPCDIVENEDANSSESTENTT